MTNDQMYSANAFKAHFSFFLKNYLRSHRYLREIVVIVIFHIFFWGFLYGEKPDHTIWAVFGSLGLLLSLVSAPSIFYLEKGNSLSFVLVHPGGRKYFLLVKILLIFLVDFCWIILFSFLYGLRFLDANYFIFLFPRLIFIALLLLLSINLLSLVFTSRPWVGAVLLILIVFGSIVNKIALFPFSSLSDVYKILSFLLPPFQELIYTAILLEFSFWRIVFLSIAVLQIGFYLWLNLHLISKRDFADG